MWIDKDQPSYVNFPQHFDKDELLPFIKSYANEHPQYVKLTDMHPDHITMISYVMKNTDYSEPLSASKRPYATLTDISSTALVPNSQPDTTSVHTPSEINVLNLGSI